MNDSLLKFGSVITILAFYIPFIFLLVNGSGAKSGRRHFYRSVKNILVREDNDLKVIEQISIVYRKISENNAAFSKKYRTPIDICEDLLTRVTGYALWLCIMVI